MFEFLKRLFGKKEEVHSTNVDPLTAAALTTDTSSDEPIADAPDSTGESNTQDEGYDGGGDFDID